eukprot:11780-Pelagococcus_subviridis.AAC.2
MNEIARWRRVVETTTTTTLIADVERKQRSSIPPRASSDRFGARGRADDPRRTTTTPRARAPWGRRRPSRT